MPKKTRNRPPAAAGKHRLSSSVEEMLAAALERGDESLQTGRYIVTFKEGAESEGARALAASGLRVADARDFTDQALALEDAGDADAAVFPEIGAAVIGGAPAGLRAAGMDDEIAEDSPYQTIEPEYFVFAEADSDPYLRGFVRAAEAIAQDLRAPAEAELEPEEDPQVVGATWVRIPAKWIARSA